MLSGHSMAEALILISPSCSTSRHFTHVNTSSKLPSNKLSTSESLSCWSFLNAKASDHLWRINPRHVGMQQFLSACLSTSSNSPESFGNIDSPHTITRTTATKEELLNISEPKWKQKLAAADERAERTRQLTLQVEKEYKNKQFLLRKENAMGVGNVISLSEIEYSPYLTGGGFISDCSQVDAKATVYAIFDQQKCLQYVGVTRQVHNSMRLHFARVPTKCFYVKVYHVSKPSRSLLEQIRSRWISENGVTPIGNDDGPHQNIWENPLDCKPLMTDEEQQKFKEVSGGPMQAKFLKDVARRVEKTILAGFEERKCKEKLRFDPKLKEKGLLDLKNVKTQVDSSVPTTNLNSASAIKA